MGMVVMAAGGSAVNGDGGLLATLDNASKGSDQSVRLGQGTGVARDPMDDAPRPLRKVREFSLQMRLAVTQAVSVAASELV